MTSTNDWSNRDTNRHRRIASRSQSRDNTNKMNTVDTPTRENRPPTMLHVDTNGTPTPIHLICIDQHQTVLSRPLIEPLIETTRACKRVSAFSTVWPTNCIALRVAQHHAQNQSSRDRRIDRSAGDTPTSQRNRWPSERRRSPSRSPSRSPTKDKKRRRHRIDRRSIAQLRATLRGIELNHEVVRSNRRQTLTRWYADMLTHWHTDWRNELMTCVNPI